MAYATPRDMIDRFTSHELTHLTTVSGQPYDSAYANTKVMAALDDATAFADSFISARYDLPLPSTPAALTKAVCDIARYYLHGRRVEKDDPVRLAWMEAERWLRAVARGEAKLELAGDEPDASGNLTVTTTDNARPLTAETMKGFV